MNKPENITIDTIAEKAGTSKMTVSRVINNHPYVKSETRSKILNLIKKFKYHPNLTAVNLSRQSPQTIALVIQYEHLFTTYYFIEILQGIEKIVDECSYNLVILNVTSQEEDAVERITSWYFGKFVKGFLVLAPPENSVLVKKMREADVPFVLIGASRGFKGSSFVDVENYTGAYKAAKYLIDLGHKHIGFIAGPPERGDAREREAGFRQALADKKIPISENLVVCGHYKEDLGYQAMLHLLIQPTRPTAVFAANDLMAKGALMAVKESNLQVPKDISLVGFDDIDIAAHLVPPLTTVKQPMFRLGTEAASFLIEQNPEENKPLHLVLPTELIIRESSVRIWHFQK
ncbi:MAG: LacI family DNA-binding transcriptional regulator [bacterium]|nr:LacI family DNA-binding transcriptional regulator [bacterium]MDD5353594.1 LacI family DNA-binding transcriptional regulator [bacterium]MDD5757334.1 LacI family DNA-binding transcriptional regulator [bacterium]